MKRVLLLLAMAGVLCAAGCAEGWFSGNEVGEHLQKGISGEGTLAPIDHSNDPNIGHEVPQTHP